MDDLQRDNLTLLRDDFLTDEAAWLKLMEIEIARGMMRQGMALGVIHDNQLWLKAEEPYENFDTYCLERWGFTANHGLTLVRMAEQLVHMAPETLPDNEGQGRALVKFSTEFHEAIMITARAHAKRNSKKLSATIITSVGEVMTTLAATGAINDPHEAGQQLVFDEAVEAETQGRRQQHIAANSKRVTVLLPILLCEAVDEIARLMLSEKPVYMTAWYEEDDDE